MKQWFLRKRLQNNTLGSWKLFEAWFLHFHWFSPKIVQAFFRVWKQKVNIFASFDSHIAILYKTNTHSYFTLNSISPTWAKTLGFFSISNSQDQISSTIVGYRWRKLPVVPWAHMGLSEVPLLLLVDNQNIDHHNSLPVCLLLRWWKTSFKFDLWKNFAHNNTCFLSTPKNQWNKRQL